MKLNAKALALLILVGTSFQAQANCCDPCAPSHRIFLGVEGDYLRAYGDFFNTGVVTALDGIHQHLVTFDSKYRWAYRAYAGYYFCDRNYLGIDYSYYKNNTHRDLVTSDAFFPIDRHVHPRYKYDDAKFVLGHTFGRCLWNLNIYGGLEYVDINRHKFVHEILAEPQDIHTKVKFNGLGPTFGFEGAYNVFPNFQLVGGASAGLIVTEVQNNLTVSVLDSLGEEISFDKIHTVGVNLTAKLGVAYVTDFCCKRLRVEAGYKVQSFVAPEGGEGTTLAVNHDVRSSFFNFSTSGPYIGATIGF